MIRDSGDYVERAAMVIRTKGFVTSTGDPDYDGLAYVYCTDESGYCLSLCRMPDDELVEVMVLDQINHRTREIAVELSCDELRVTLSPASAAHLDGVTEYTIPLVASEIELHDLDAALSAIFEGGRRGRYDSRSEHRGGHA
jgi:hypothetical protein